MGQLLAAQMRRARQGAAAAQASDAGLDTAAGPEPRPDRLRIASGEPTSETQHLPRATPRASPLMSRPSDPSGEFEQPGATPRSLAHSLWRADVCSRGAGVPDGPVVMHWQPGTAPAQEEGREESREEWVYMDMDMDVEMESGPLHMYVHAGSLW